MKITPRKFYPGKFYPVKYTNKFVLKYSHNFIKFVFKIFLNGFNVFNRKLLMKTCPFETIYQTNIIYN